MIGILPTVMPRRLRGRLDERQRPLPRPQRRHARRPRRGCSPGHRGAYRRAPGALFRLPGARVGLHVDAVAPAGGAPVVRRPLERRPGPRWRPVGSCRQLPFFLGKRLWAESRIECSARPPTPVRRS
jgi:hypothetical protein